MKATNTAYELIRHFEGLRLSRYLCPGGEWTIGYGHKLDRSSPIKTITKAVAESMLVEDIVLREKQVNKLGLDLQQHEFDAILDFVFNLGIGTFTRSTMFRLLQIGDKDAAADQFERYRLANGVVQPGLVRRRAAERKVFIGEVWTV